MKYELTHIRLMVKDVAVSTRFYRDVLGWQPRFPSEDTVYQEFDTGAITFSLYQQDLMSDVAGTLGKPARPDAQDGVLLSIHVEDVNGAVADLQAKGVQIVVPATDRPVWALRTAHFRDPDGNLIEINHDIPGN